MNDPEEFRRHAHELVDWIADYWQGIGTERATPDVRPGDVRSRLAASPPEQGEPFERIMADFQEVIKPGVAHWGHPGWFAYFPSNSSPPSVLGEILAAGLGAQCMSWATSPAATELEQQMMAWLVSLFGLPEGFTGSIQDTASTSTLTAFLTARHRHGDLPRMTAYWSSESHSSVNKAARLAGIPVERHRVIGVDETFAIDPAALAAAIAADQAAGLVPGVVVATVGTTSSTGCDPVRTVGTIAREAGAWFHVDGAYGGTTMILPELRHLFDGIELADSLVINPHKWLMTSFDCSTYFVRDVELLVRTFGENPEYLRTTHDAEVVNYRDWGIPLGRRFRALKLWFMLRSYGTAALREMVRSHIAMAQRLAAIIADTPEWEVLAPVPFGLICFRQVPTALLGDEAAIARHNAALMERANATGRVFLSHTRLGGRYVIRMSIGQFRTEWRHVAEAWELLNGGKPTSI